MPDALDRSSEWSFGPYIAPHDGASQERPHPHRYDPDWHLGILRQPAHSGQSPVLPDAGRAPPRNGYPSGSRGRTPALRLVLRGRGSCPGAGRRTDGALRGGGPPSPGCTAAGHGGSPFLGRRSAWPSAPGVRTPRPPTRWRWPWRRPPRRRGQSWRTCEARRCSSPATRRPRPGSWARRRARSGWRWPGAPASSADGPCSRRSCRRRRSRRWSRSCASIRPPPPRRPRASTWPPPAWRCETRPGQWRSFARSGSPPPDRRRRRPGSGWRPGPPGGRCRRPPPRTTGSGAERLLPRPRRGGPSRGRGAAAEEPAPGAGPGAPGAGPGRPGRPPRRPGPPSR